MFRCVVYRVKFGVGKFAREDDLLRNRFGRKEKLIKRKKETQSSYHPPTDKRDSKKDVKKRKGKVFERVSVLGVRVNDDDDDDDNDDDEDKARKNCFLMSVQFSRFTN